MSDAPPVATSSAAADWWARQPWVEPPTVPSGPTLFSLFVEDLIAALVLAVALVAADALLRALGRGRRDPRILPIAWTVFGLGVLLRWIQVWPQGSWVVAASVAIFAVPLMWTVGRDVVLGPWVQARVREGALVRIDGVEGRVRAVRARGIELETEGWIRFVPYRSMLGTVAFRSTTIRRNAFPVQVEVEVDGAGDLAKAQERLRELVLCSPWASMEARPRVEVSTGSDDRIRVRVEAATFSPEGVAALQGHVRSAWRDEEWASGPVSDRPAR